MNSQFTEPWGATNEPDPQFWNQTIEYPETDLGEFAAENLQQYFEVKNNPAENPTLDNFVVALPSLYTPEGKVDIIAMKIMMRKLADAGVRTFLIEGTTAESSLHSEEIQLAIIEDACSIRDEFIEEYNESFYVIAGTGSNSTEEQYDLSTGAINRGTDSNLLLDPYYLKCSPEAMLRHFLTALQEGPAIIYSIAGRTSLPVPIEVLEVLAHHPNFIGVKECDGPEKMKQLIALRERLRKEDIDFKIWSGEDGNELTGEDGYISVGGVLRPDIFGNNINDHNHGSNVSKTAWKQQEKIADLLFSPNLANPSLIHSAIEAIITPNEEIQDNRLRATQEDKNTAHFISPVEPPQTKEQQAVLQNGLRQLGYSEADIMTIRKIVHRGVTPFNAKKFQTTLTHIQ